jgi:hypothetical protein
MRQAVPLYKRPVDILLVLLYGYFLFSCIFIERHYCAAPLEADDSDWLLRETYSYSEQYNPLFLSRPEWLRTATCISAYVLSSGYVLSIIAILGAVDGLRIPLLMFSSFKLYALMLYYSLELFGSMPVPSLTHFLAPELPYLLALLLALFRLRSAHPFTLPAPLKAKKNN